MQITAFSVGIIAIGLMLTNVAFFAVLNWKSLTDSYSRQKRNKDVKQMLNQAVNRIETRNILNKNRQ